MSGTLVYACRNCGDDIWLNGAWWLHRVLRYCEKPEPGDIVVRRVAGRSPSTPSPLDVGYTTVDGVDLVQLTTDQGRITLPLMVAVVHLADTIDEIRAHISEMED
jgi:hypothetical protein